MNHNGRYILNGTTPEPCEDLIKWAMAFEKTKHLAESHLGNGSNIRVSTIFLGIDHSHTDGKCPLLFETMAFGGSFDQTQWRYATYDEAMRGHAAMVGEIEAALKGDAR